MRWRAATLAVAALLFLPSPAGAKPTPRRAVILLQPGSVPQDRQARFCLEYAEQHDYEIVGVVPPSGVADAVTFVVAGRADLVLTAFAGRSQPGDLRELAHDADVQVEYVRPPQVRREIGNMLAGMYRRSGGDIDQLARLLGESTSDLRAKLARLGIRTNRRPR